MGRRALLDTGFVVALVNAADEDHTRCLAVWKDLRARLFSVEGVHVECAHLVRRIPGAAADASRIIFESGTEIVPLSSERAHRATTLMAKYQDVPMDLVDALLVTVAEDHDIREVLTLDGERIPFVPTQGSHSVRVVAMRSEPSRPAATAHCRPAHAPTTLPPVRSPAAQGLLDFLRDETFALGARYVDSCSNELDLETNGAGRPGAAVN